MQNSKIQWCDSTFNPWIGCTKVSPGCAHCYAETLDRNRYSKTLGDGTKASPVSHWGPGAPRHHTSAANWKQPLRWNEYAYSFSQCSCCGWRGDRLTKKKHSGNVAHCPDCDSRGTLDGGKRPRVFCSSLADWLDDEVPVEWLVDLLDLIRRTPNLDWLLLAKRPENWKTRIQDAMWHSTGKVEPEFINNDGFKAGNPILEFCRLWLEGEAPTNVWIGTTVEDQERADERIPFLRAIPAKVRFLSCEPLLGQVDLRTWLGNLRPDPIHWVICGGESGTNARPMHPDWARSLRDQCKAAGVPFFFKQWGEWSPLVGAHFEKSASEGALAGWQSAMEKRGKLRAGRLLDGVEHNNFPEVAR